MFSLGFSRDRSAVPRDDLVSSPVFLELFQPQADLYYLYTTLETVRGLTEAHLRLNFWTDGVGRVCLVFLCSCARLCNASGRSFFSTSTSSPQNLHSSDAGPLQRKQSSLSSTRSTASSISYQKSASLPSSASGRSGRGQTQLTANSFLIEFKQIKREKSHSQSCESSSCDYCKVLTLTSGSRSIRSSALSLR